MMRAPSPLSRLTLLVLLGVAAVAGCRQRDLQPPPAAATAPEPSFRTDEQIRQEVALRLSSNPGLGGELIDVTVEDGVVRLGGSVSEFHKIVLAAGEAGNVLGVRQVLTRLQVR